MEGRPANRRGWRHRLGEAVRRILAEHATPAELGLSVALGVFVACTPFYGLQTLLAFAAAWLLGLNRVVAVAAAQVSIAPLSPFLIAAEIQVGGLLLHGQLYPLDPTAWRGTSVAGVGGALAVAWLAGGAAMGLVLGGLLGGATFAVAHERQMKALGPALRAALGRARERYRAAPHQVRHYARIKYVTDPCYLRVVEALTALTRERRLAIVDLGCGVGMLGVLVGEMGLAAEVHGVDWDQTKVELARKVAADLDGITFSAGDLISDPLPAADCVVLLDVLHYYSHEQQDALLERVARTLSPVGALLVREADADRHQWPARVFERLAAGLGWHRTAGRFHYRSTASLAATLERLGFTIRVVPAGNVVHRGNVLIVASPRNGEAAAV